MISFLQSHCSKRYHSPKEKEYSFFFPSRLLTVYILCVKPLLKWSEEKVVCTFTGCQRNRYMFFIYAHIFAWHMCQRISIEFYRIIVRGKKWAAILQNRNKYEKGEEWKERETTFDHNVIIFFCAKQKLFHVHTHCRLLSNEYFRFTFLHENFDDKMNKVVLMLISMNLFIFASSQQWKWYIDDFQSDVDVNEWIETKLDDWKY